MFLVQQYNMINGLELFGDWAEEDTKNELQKIHDFGTYIPMDAKFISRGKNEGSFFTYVYCILSAEIQVHT